MVKWRKIEISNIEIIKMMEEISKMTEDRNQLNEGRQNSVKWKKIEMSKMKENKIGKFTFMKNAKIWIITWRQIN